MNREDAEREAARRDREETAAVYRWFARSDAEDEWSLVKVGGVPGARVRPLRGPVEASPGHLLPTTPGQVSGVMLAARGAADHGPLQSATALTML